MLLSDALAASATCSSEVGGKAWNLLRLREKGFLVPQFWIVPRAQFARTRVSPDLIAELGAALPEGRLFIVEGAGHIAMLERPERLNPELRTFAREATGLGKASGRKRRKGAA